MISERRRQVEELYHATLKREPGERAAFLAQTDPELRSEVESLFAQRGATASTGRQLAAGAQLGPYKIEASLGAGGMGEVYKARDTRLDRIVAIRTSQQRFDDRFAREAHAIAALNHPNICSLYDVGPDYLVMEYVEGKPVARVEDPRKLTQLQGKPG